MQEKDTLHLEMERLLGTTTALLKQDSIRSSNLPAPYSPRLSRANSETNSVVSSSSKRVISGSPLFSASQRAGGPSEAESLQLDRATLESKPSSLSLRASREAGVTFDTRGLRGQKLDSPVDTPRSYQTSTLFGSRPAVGERRSSSPGNLTRPRTSDLLSTLSPSFLHQSSSPQLAARPSTTGSMAARPTSPPEYKRKISFSSPAPSSSQMLARGRPLSTQLSSRSLSPYGLESKRQASLSPIPTAGPARPSSSGLQSPRLLATGQRSIRPSPSSTSLASRLGPSTSPRPNDQASGSPRGTGTLSMRTRAQDEELHPPELLEWQAVAKEAKSMLDHGQVERQDLEHRMASLRAKVQGWEGLLDDVVQEFDKSIEETFREIFSRARTRVKVHEAKSAPSVPDTDGGGLHTCKASTYRPTNRKSPLTVDFLQKDPSSDSHSLAPSSSSSLNDAASQHCTAMPTPQPHLRSTSAFNDATSQHRAAMPTPQPHLSSTSAFNPFEAAAAPTLAGQLHPLPAAHEFNPHLPSQQLYLPTRTQHVPFSEQPPSDYWKPGVHRAAAQGLGPQSSPSYAQPVQEGPFPSAAQPSMNGSQALPQSLAPPHPQASAQRGPAPPCHVVPAPPQLASTAAACLWQEFANSRAYCPYKNPGEWVALRM
mmetsp:Transcript_27473/g.74320  ORF Transcript_27473/g.74320 Transcript_27473/m.74320 type:complete len:654 (+) Transcript_27473:237-2198(+)